MKDLNVRIVDLETRSLNPPRPAATSRRLESRIEELTSQLNQTNKDSSRIHRSADKALHEAERQRARLEDEVKSYEEKILGMRHKMDELVSLPLAHVPCWTLIPFRSSRRRFRIHQLHRVSVYSNRNKSLLSCNPEAKRPS